MRSFITVLTIALLLGCATPTLEDPVPAPSAPAPESTADRVDPVQPTPVIEVPLEPERQPEPAPEPAAEPEAEPAPESAPRPPAEIRPAAPSPIDPEPAPATPAPAATAPPTGNLTGTISILQNGREQPFGSLHLNQTVIAWQPTSAASASAMPQQQIVTRRSRFFPQTMVVTRGTEVRFPNMDSIQHNVFSLTPGHQFDVGLYGEGEGRSHVFNGTGMVEMYCNVHPNMAAFMLVLDTPHFITPDENGDFMLRDLPVGPGELLIWNYRAEEVFQRVPIRLTTSNDPLALSVNITRPAVPQHTNKHGEPFGRDRSRP